MRKNILVLFFIGLFQFTQAQSLYQVVDGEISFFSKTPLENVDATHKSVKGLMNIKSSEFAFVVTIIGFHFKKTLMEKHFNEKYMESDMYKTAMFKGTVTEKIDYTKAGEYNVTAKGVLTIHGVTKERTIKGKLIIKKEKIQLIAGFDVKLADYNIKTPRIITKKIAETIVVKVNVYFEKK